MSERTTTQLPISAITVDSTINPRDGGTNAEHVDEMCEWLIANPKKDMEAVVVYHDEETHHLSEGFHRHRAYAKAGRKRMPCEVRKGNRKDAKVNAAASNKGHGLKRTNEDKRIAVRNVIEEMTTWTDRQVADHVGVDHKMVGDIRASFAASRVGDSPTQTDGDEEARVGESPTQNRGSGRTGGSSSKAKKEKQAEDAARLLLKDSARTDEDVAKEVGCKSKVVAIARKALEQAGRITKPKPKAAPVPVEDRGDAWEPDDEETEPSKEEEATKPESKATGAKIVPPPVLDGWGIPIQPHAVEAFAAIPKFKELVAAIQHAAKLFNEVANLPGGIFLTLPEVSSYHRGKKLEDGEYADKFVHPGIEQALNQVKSATPTYTVCPYQFADKPHDEKCNCCRNLNWTPVLGKSIPPVCVERAKDAHGVKESAHV